MARQIEYIDDIENVDVATPSSNANVNFLDNVNTATQIPVSAPRTALEQGLQGATFGFADEVTDTLGAAIASLYTGESFGDLRKEARGMSSDRMQQQFEQMPVLSIGSNIAGGFLTGGALAAPKALTGTAAQTGVRGVLNAIPQIGQRVATGLGTGAGAARTAKVAGAGALTGGLYGAGTANEGERFEGAAAGSALGGTFSVLAPIAISQVKNGAKGVSNIIANRIGRTAGELQPVEKAITKVAKRLRRDFPDDAEYIKQLNRYASRQGVSLIEEGGASTRGLGEGASMFPSGGQKAAEFFDVKIDMAPEKMKAVLSRTVSPEVSYYDTIDDILRVGRAQAKPFYDKAFNGNQSVNSKMIDRILNTPEGKAGLETAVKNMQTQMSLVAKPDKELGEIAREIGILSKGGVAKGLKLKTLDYVKRSMDRLADGALRANDDDAAARFARINSLRKAFVDELDSLDKTGAYAKARGVAGDYLQAKKAIEDGIRFLKDDAELVARNFANFSPAEKRAYKVGIVKSIRDVIDNSADGQNIARLFTKEANRKKLQSVLSNTEYNKLLGRAKEIDDIYKLRNQMTGNSRTAIRQIAAEEFTQEGLETAQKIAMRGFSSVGVDKLVQFISRKATGLSDKAAGEVAEILYETDSKAKAAIVRKLFNQYKSSKGFESIEAGKKLEAFYAISDNINKIRGNSIASQAAIGGQ